MAGNPESQTSPTLLARLRQDPTDEASWRRFVEQYGPKIYGWCRKWKLQDADAQDVTQAVLARLAAKMRSFAYDPARSFRGWLRTLASHARSDFLARRHRAGLVCGDDSAVAVLETAEARQDLVRRLEEAFDREVLEAAMARVRVRIQARTWEAFRLTALEGLSGAAAAEQLQMPVAAVYVAKREVKQRLAEEIRRLEASGAD
jgi:RNA polymerase sigma-70 factor (ECF subfamily)